MEELDLDNSEDLDLFISSMSNICIIYAKPRTGKTSFMTAIANACCFHRPYLKLQNDEINMLNSGGFNIPYTDTVCVSNYYMKFKKFGYSILDQKEGSSSKIAKLMGMHKNYDYVFTSSEACKKNFAEAFNVSLDKMVVMPLPCVDLITNPKYIKASRKRVLSKYPDINKKKVILYAPTFRKNKDMTKDIKKLINEVDFEKYNLVVKLHPLSKTVINDNRIIFDNSFSTLDMAVVSDYVVTDYSAVVFEIAIMNKPLFFYAYDKKSYLDDRNFYMNFDKDMPGVISESPREIIRAIEKEKYDLKVVKKFATDNVAKVYGGYTANVAKFILKLF